MGHLPAQPRRADPRDGHRRGPRLHVGRVRQGPADEGQHRHPPPAGPAARQRHQPDGAVHRAAAVAARLARCLYYGDEIGMGDNIWLGDRDGVRTPMQWTPDRNAGFSTGDPGQAVPARRSRTRSTATRASTSRPQLDNSVLAAALDPADDPGAPAAPGVRARRRSTTSAAPTRRCCPTSREHDAGDDRHHRCASTTCRRFPQPVELDLRRWEGVRPRRAPRRRAVPADRRAARTC